MVLGEGEHGIQFAKMKDGANGSGVKDARQIFLAWR